MFALRCVFHIYNFMRYLQNNKPRAHGPEFNSQQTLTQHKCPGKEETLNDMKIIRISGEMEC